MRSWRLLASALSVNEVGVEVAYADLFVVLREGDDQPGPNDWEATVQTADVQRFEPGAYQLRVETPDGHALTGVALLRFSDGRRHLFRGDGELVGVGAAIA